MDINGKYLSRPHIDKPNLNRNIWLKQALLTQ